MEILPIDAEEDEVDEGGEAVGLASKQGLLRDCSIRSEKR
jgi:hypothetical protein